MVRIPSLSRHLCDSVDIRSCIVFISARFLLVSSDSGSTQNCKSRVSAINNLAVDATLNNDNGNNIEVHKIYS